MSYNTIPPEKCTVPVDVRAELLPVLRKDVEDAKAELERLQKLFAK